MPAKSFAVTSPRKPAHRPERHSAVIDLTHEKLMQRAVAIGPATVEVLAQQVQRRRHPEESLRASLGILRLAKDFSPDALERAAERAVALATFSYRALRALISVPDSTHRTTFTCRSPTPTCAVVSTSADPRSIDVDRTDDSAIARSTLARHGRAQSRNN